MKTQLVTALLFVAAARVAAARPAQPASCDSFLLAPREVNGKKVGPSSCQMQETPITYDGKKFTRVDIGLDGTVDGYAAKEGDYKDYFTNGPDLVFPQTWGDRKIYFGVAKYEKAKGSAMAVLVPDGAAWNGRIFVTVHGRGLKVLALAAGSSLLVPNS